MNTATPAVSSLPPGATLRIERGLAVVPKIIHRDFFSESTQLARDYGRARAFRDAWAAACNHRAPVKLRKELRQQMRYWAKEAVKECRLQLTKDARDAARFSAVVLNSLRDRSVHASPVA